MFSWKYWLWAKSFFGAIDLRSLEQWIYVLWKHFVKTLTQLLEWLSVFLTHLSWQTYSFSHWQMVPWLQNRFRYAALPKKQYLIDVCQRRRDRTGVSRIILSHEIRRIESRILSAMSKLDEIFLNPQVRVQFRTISGTSRNLKVENWEPTLDRFQNDHQSWSRYLCQPVLSIL